ncbi:hypothetical protein Ancab_007148 [Ancistrocladus abbreviatus]
MKRTAGGRLARATVSDLKKPPPRVFVENNAWPMIHEYDPAPQASTQPAKNHMNTMRMLFSSSPLPQRLRLTRSCRPRVAAWHSSCSSSSSNRTTTTPTSSRAGTTSMSELSAKNDGAAASATASTADSKDVDVVVQYVVLRRDIIDKWPLGSVVTQGCHASVAAVWTNKEDPHTLHYCSPHNLDSMHKVTLEVKGEGQMLRLSEKLNASGIVHKLWIEQPENIPTCLATKPYPKSVVSSFFKKLKLCK